jgi:hypothetical protein
MLRTPIGLRAQRWANLSNEVWLTGVSPGTTQPRGAVESHLAVGWLVGGCAAM